MPRTPRFEPYLSRSRRQPGIDSVSRVNVTPLRCSDCLRWGASFRFVVRATLPLHDTVAVFLWASPNRDDSATAASLILGRRVGRGRVVLVGDPLLLRNTAVWEGHSAIAIQRALEWLAPPTRMVTFDEYHQTHSAPAGPDVFGAISRTLTDTAAGRAGVQGIAAVLVLLLAIGVRPISPRPTTVLQRRSLLEHVDALGRAYQQIHAGQFGTRQLVRGLRRRHPAGGAAPRWAAASDADYLMGIQRRYGTPQSDIEAVTSALDTPVGDTAFAEAGRALGRIEHAMDTL